MEFNSGFKGLKGYTWKKDELKIEFVQPFEKREYDLNHAVQR